jgi:predicted integral membrane protein DUF2269
VDLFKLLLFLHVIAAIAAFGPGFAAMVVGPMVAREPQHGNFYARTQLTTARSLVTPLALSMALTGVAMVAVRGWTNIVGTSSWLIVAIVLYVVAIAYSFAVQAPAGRKLVELTSTPPAPGAGPNPEIPATARRLRNGGILLTALVTVIVFLMVAKPF